MQNTTIQKLFHGEIDRSYAELLFRRIFLSLIGRKTFCLENVYQTTPFTQSCRAIPVIVEDKGVDLAQAIFICHKNLPYLQVSFFEALENQQEAVELLLTTARQKARDIGASNVVIGLNAHISYGVGILTDGFSCKNTFDSLYNKPYYPSYFSRFRNALNIPQRKVCGPSEAAKDERTCQNSSCRLEEFSKRDGSHAWVV